MLSNVVLNPANHLSDRALALDHVFLARRAQGKFRIVIISILSLSFGPILGWQLTLPVLAVYAGLQFAETLGLGRPRHGRGGSEGLSLAPGLALLALNSFIFGLPSLWLERNMGSAGVACAAYLLTGGLINNVGLTLGSRLAFGASTGPFFLYALLIPVEARLVDPATSVIVLTGLAIGAVMLAAALTKLWLQWDAVRTKEATAASLQQAERDANETRLLKLAQQDALTGLGNRIALQNALQAALASNQPGALFVIDLDGFKHINDMLGHGIGDEVLCQVALRIAAGCRDVDTVTRLGGDEFALVVPGLEAPSVPARAAALLECIGGQLKLHDGTLAIRASIGVALFTDHGHDAEQLLANADLALYQAKAGGRHCHRIFNTAIRERAEEKLQLDTQLHLAVERGEFELYYQPQVRLSDGALTGAEALLRWHHPKRGLLAPGAFIGALETNVLALRLGQWIIETACSHAALWRRRGLPDFRMAVNLFGAQVRSPELVSRLRSACMQAGLPPSALEIEITENIILSQEDEIIAPLRALRALGIGLAFDDYGTGYASLSLLKRYPVSKLKIDRLFIREICDSEQDAVIVCGLINMARALGIAVIAEGVETQAQADLLAQNGCVEAQGYLFGRPVSAAEFERSWLKRDDIDLTRIGNSGAA